MEPLLEFGRMPVLNTWVGLEIRLLYVPLDFSGYGGPYPGPALLIAGGRSPYVQESDLPLFGKHFPNGRVEVLEDCGHWLHYICSEQFEQIVRQFLMEL